MIKELEVFIDIVDPKTSKLLKKNVICKRTFETDKIQVEQFFNNKGNPVKKYCFIYDDNKIFKANHSYEYIKKLTQPIQVIGFAGKSKHGKSNNKN